MRSLDCLRRMQFINPPRNQQQRTSRADGGGLESQFGRVLVVVLFTSGALLVTPIEEMMMSSETARLRG
jgi:hypothetical protein